MTIDFSAYTILVVEDSEINLFVLKSILEAEQFNVFLAPHAKGALEILERERVDLILTDVVMAEMDGFELTRKLKSLDRYKDIPVLFITGLDSPDDIVKGFDCGGVDYITKPFNKNELLRRIKHQIKLIDSYNTIVRQTQELNEAIDNRDRLYAIMAHDLRTPISSLKMIFNILAMKTDDAVAEPEYVNMLYTGNDIAEQLFCLLDNLLKWTKSSLGVLTFIPQEFELDETLLGVIETLKPTAKLKDISFDLSIADEVAVRFDVDIMKSILRNLLINAVKFSHEGSVVSVCLRRDENSAVFEVVDRGIGMSEEAQRKLADRIFQEGRLAAANKEGKGLGLWIAYHFIRRHGGVFFFESEEHKGSRFGFKIPCFVPDGEPVSGQIG